MIARVTTVIGKVKYEFEIEEKDEKETLNKAITLSNPRKKCDSCGEIGLDSKYFTTNKDKEGNIYVNTKCAKCGARSKLGSYKTGGYFWHEYEIYDKNNASKSNAQEDDFDIPLGDEPGQ